MSHQGTNKADYNPSESALDKQFGITFGSEFGVKFGNNVGKQGQALFGIEKTKARV